MKTRFERLDDDLFAPRPPEPKPVFVSDSRPEDRLTMERIRQVMADLAKAKVSSEVIVIDSLSKL